MNNRSTNSVADSRRAYLLMIIVTWCWGCNAILSKIAVGEISPMMLVTLRWLGAVLLCPFAGVLRAALVSALPSFLDATLRT